MCLVFLITDWPIVNWEGDVLLALLLTYARHVINTYIILFIVIFLVGVLQVTNRLAL